MDEPVKNERNATNLVALIFAMIFPTIVTLVYFKWLSDHPSSTQQTAFAIGKFIQFALPVVWVWCFFRYRLKRGRDKTELDTSDSKLRKIPNWLLAVGFGVGVCLVMGATYWFLSGTELIMSMSQEVEAKVTDLGITSVWKYVMLSFFYALFHSFMEEYYWRWFVYDMLKQFTSVPVANIISSLGFMAHHVVLLSVYFTWTSPMIWLCSAGVAIGGIFWAWLYQKTGTLFWPWISHMIVDAGIFALGYVIVGKLFVGS